jgi:hypothetical protein
MEPCEPTVHAEHAEGEVHDAWKAAVHGRERIARFRPGTIDGPKGGARVTVWFTVQLADTPGSLARVATALAERNVNITGIVGVAEDTDGALMLTTSDPTATRAAFESLGLAFEEHDPTGDIRPESMTVGDMRPGAAGRGSLG